MERSIICGNKRKYFNSPGNQNFRVLIKTYRQEYKDAQGKIEKSGIVTKVMYDIRDSCPVGAFIAFEKGRWYEVSERTAREKVGSFFRDCLSDNYKSSAQNKIAKRKSQRITWGASEAVQTSCWADLKGEEEEESTSSASVSFYDVDDLQSVPLGQI
jgi:hypothetical protein